MPKSPVISIVIATYNSAETLPLTIESVFSQRSMGVEIIVVDGASTDSTPQLLLSMDSMLTHWISEPDLGIYDAWNKGVALATGEWIGFLGDDDILFPGAIECYRSFIQKNPPLDYLSSRVQLQYDHGSTRVIGQPWTWAKFRRYMNVAHVGSLHHFSLFQKYGGFDASLKICGDYEFLLRARGQLKAGFIDKVLVQMSAGGISNSSPKSILETYHIKQRLHSVGEFNAFADLVEAYLKWLLRYFTRMLTVVFLGHSRGGMS